MATADRGDTLGSLQEPERFARSLLDALPAHVAILDETGAIIATNVAWDRFGRENGGLPERVGVGCNYLDVCDHAASGSGEAPQQIANAIRHLIQDRVPEEACVFEYPCHAPTEQRWFYCRVSRLAGDGPCRLVVSHENVTAAKEMEASLVASEMRFRSAFEQAAIGIVHTSTDGRLIRCNPRYRGIVGYSVDELESLPIMTITHPDDRAQDQQLRGSLYRGEITSYTLEKRYVRKTGEVRWVSVTASLIHSPTGEIEYVLAVVEDIHQRKLTTLALEALNTERSGVAFLQVITQALTTLLEVDWAFVAELDRASGRRITARAFCERGQAGPESTFDLEGTPCDLVVAREMLVIAEGVQERYPRHEMLKALGAESYAALPLWSKGQIPLGTLVVLSARPLRDIDAVKTLLRLFALRAGAELESEREEQKFRDLFNSSPSAVLMMDTRGLITLASSAVRGVFGRNPLSVVGHEPWQLFPAGLRDTCQADFERFFHGESPDSQDRGQFEMEGQHADGRTFPIAVALSRLNTADGPMVVAHVRDITERKQAQLAQQRINQELETRVVARTEELERANAALVVKEEEVRSVLQYMVDCVVGIDERGTILSANPATTEILGYTADELIGHNVSMLMPEPDRGAHDGYLERYLRTGTARIIGIGRAVEGLHKNGSRVDLELAVSEYAIHGQRRFTGILRDVSDRVRLIKTLERALADAEQANRAKSAFLAAMSHEIRTPMNGVIGMVQVLQQSSLRRSQSEMVKVIQDSALALLGIIDDVLDFSKIEAEQLQVEHEPMSLAAVVEGACDTLDPLASSKGVELTLFIDPLLPDRVLGDAARLRQVILNLAGNAIKFSSDMDRAGWVAVRVTAVAMDSTSPAFEISVADNGIGIDEEARSRLFSPFTQADMTTTRRFGGTGLGLSISKRLVHLMGGDVEVQSRPGKGSVFKVRLPLERAPGTPLARRDGWDAVLQGLSCIVFSDTTGLGEDLRAYLVHAGASVEAVAGMGQAKEVLARTTQGEWIVVVDKRGADALDDLRAMRPGGGAGTVRFVLLGRGARRRPRTLGPDAVELDGNVLHRGVFLEAVALAAGGAMDHLQNGSAAAADTMPAPLSNPDAQASGRSILVAEDNEINQKVILKQLALFGWTADIARNGREALARWREGEYGLVLTDLHMPEMDGYELSMAIRQAEAVTGRRRTPIVALTANAVKGEAVRCREIGMDDYVTKPVQLDTLKAVVTKWLGVEDGAAAPPDAAPLTIGAPAHAVVDVTVLAALVGDDLEVIREFLNDFRTSAQKAAAEIRRGFQAGQVSAVGAVSHKLKSSARSVGALALGELCAQMEDASKTGQLEALRPLVAKFETEMMAVDAFLRNA